MELTATEDAADAQPVDALKACSSLRAALTGHTTELQRWAVALQVESVRQSSAAKKLAQREAAATELQALEAVVEEQKTAVSRDKDDILIKQVRTSPTMLVYNPISQTLAWFGERCGDSFSPWRPDLSDT